MSKISGGKNKKQQPHKDSFHNVDIIPCASIESLINDLFICNEGSTTSKKPSTPSCLVILLWRYWQQNAVVLNNEDIVQGKMGKEIMTSDALFKSAEISAAVQNLYLNRRLEDFILCRIQAGTAAAVEHSTKKHKNKNSTNSNMFPFFSFHEFEKYIFKQLLSVECQHCSTRTKDEFSLFLTKKNKISLTEPFLVTDASKTEKDVDIQSLEEGLLIPADKRQPQLYLSLATTSRTGNSTKLLQLHHGSAPHNGDSISTPEKKLATDHNQQHKQKLQQENLKLWMDWLFSVLVQFKNSSLNVNNYNTTTNLEQHQKTKQRLCNLKQILRFSSSLFDGKNALATSSSTCFISKFELQRMEKIREMKKRIFTNENWKSNESSLLSSNSRSASHSTYSKQHIDYRQKSHLDGIDQDLYDWLQEMTMLILELTTANPTAIAIETLWDIYEQQLPTICKASAQYRSEQMYSPCSPRVPLLWNNEQLRKAMEQKHYAQFDSIHEIYKALDQIILSSDINSSAGTNPTTTEELPMRIMNQRVSVLMRTIVKGTVEEIRQEQKFKNNLLLESIRGEFQPKCSRKKDFVIQAVHSQIASLLQEDEKKIITSWIQDFQSQWVHLDKEVNAVYMDLVKYSQNAERLYKQQDVARIRSSLEENTNDKNDTEKIVFLNKTHEILLYTCKISKLSLTQWRLLSQIIFQFTLIEKYLDERIEAKADIINNSCCGGVDGGTRRLAADAASFVFRMLEHQCMEWNADESQRELIEKLLVEEQEYANEITKAKKKKKKKPSSAFTKITLNNALATKSADLEAKADAIDSMTSPMQKRSSSAIQHNDDSPTTSVKAELTCSSNTTMEEDNPQLIIQQQISPTSEKEESPSRNIIAVTEDDNRLIIHQHITSIHNDYGEEQQTSLSRRFSERLESKQDWLCPTEQDNPNDHIVTNIELECDPSQENAAVGCDNSCFPSESGDFNESPSETMYHSNATLRQFDAFQVQFFLENRLTSLLQRNGQGDAMFVYL